jgi:DnaJ-class molecular chaperone
LTLEESLLGFKKVINHLDGKEVLLKSSESEIIQPESWHVLKGFGMPIRNKYN